MRENGEVAGVRGTRQKELGPGVLWTKGLSKGDGMNISQIVGDININIPDNRRMKASDRIEALRQWIKIVGKIPPNLPTIQARHVYVPFHDESTPGMSPIHDILSPRGHSDRIMLQGFLGQEMMDKGGDRIAD